MDGFLIREAEAADREQIGLLWLYQMRFHQRRDSRFSIPQDGCQQYEKRVAELIRSRDGKVLVAQDVASSEVVAYIMGEIKDRPSIGIDGAFGFVSDLYVMEEWRRVGLGRSLFVELRKWFVSRGVSAVELYVSERNPAAVEFWQELGLQKYLWLMHLDL